ncbi:hypothetical protein BpHYR1_033316 [Brachionus plicatilis]|uniref:Uncharacterized protein n=1 Tax=Brachionus plicatilis TaxID=10195 RepID=A0A3M7SJQ1_BRAPC|nr:hypothetical protein BpHYR1_033316 [Brachionus plicatilis]
MKILFDLKVKNSLQIASTYPIFIVDNFKSLPKLCLVSVLIVYRITHFEELWKWWLVGSLNIGKKQANSHNKEKNKINMTVKFGQKTNQFISDRSKRF